MDIRDRRTKGWLWIANDVIDEYGAQLGPYGIAVYVALCRFADNTSQHARPSLSLIAQRTGVSQRKVRYTIRELEDLGLIRTIERFTEDGDRAANDYELCSVVPGVQHDMPDGAASEGKGVQHDVPGYQDSVEQDLLEQDSIVHAPINGHARTTEQEWPEEFQSVKKVLAELQILPAFDDPLYWKAMEEWTDTCGFQVFYLDELRAYAAYQRSLPLAAKGRHKDLKRGFRTWVGNAINFRRRDAERKASYQRR